MGIPTFFGKWISKYIPNSIINGELDNIDYLYIDANALFHYVYDFYNSAFTLGKKDMSIDMTLSRQEDLVVNGIIELIFDEIKKLKPKKLVYIAVDGEAPLAKMNQQRKRRFLGDDKLRIQISPGTKLMERIHQNILLNMSKFEYYKNKNEPIDIIYSSYIERGEGEDKIMKFMDSLNSSPNENHVIHGLDADIIIRSFISDVKNIYVYRLPKYPSNKYELNNPQPRITVNIKEIRYYTYYYLVDRLEYQFNNDIDIMKFTKNIFFMATLIIGNDFIPKLPTLAHTVNMDYYLDKFITFFNKLENDDKNEIVKHIIKISDQTDFNIDHSFIQAYTFLLLSIVNNEERYFRENFRDLDKLPSYFRDMLVNLRYDTSPFHIFKHNWYEQLMFDTTSDESLDLISIIDANYEAKPKEKYLDDSKYNPYTNTLLSSDYIKVGKKYIINMYQDKIISNKIKFKDYHKSEYISNMVKSYLYMCLWTLNYYYKNNEFRYDLYYPYPIAPMISEIIEFRGMVGHNDGYKNTQIDVNNTRNSKLNSDAFLFKIIPNTSHIFPSKYKGLTINGGMLNDLFPTHYEKHTILARVSHEKEALLPNIDPTRVNEICLSVDGVLENNK